MNYKFLLSGKWISAPNGRVVSGTTISETARAFGGEIQIMKTVIVDNSPI
jgi:hypothetical protein